MRICINLDPLKVFTSAMPIRGMLPHLMRLRANDHFIFRAFRDTIHSETIQLFLESVKDLKNWEIVTNSFSARQINGIKLIGYPEYNTTSIKADLYLNFDADDMGSHNQPLITLLADLSVLKNPERSSHGWIGRRLRRITFKRMALYADRIVTISKVTAQDAFDCFPMTTKKTAVIYNGINSEWFEKEPLYDDKSPSYWIWYGFNSERKNLNGLLEGYVLAQKKQKGDFPRLLLIVSGPLGALKVKVAELELNETVEIKPMQPLSTLIELVDGCRALVFPSFYEGFGLPVIEVMARGKRVLCSKVSALPEVSNNMAYFCDPSDSLSIANALLKELSKDTTKDEELRYRSWAKQFTYQNCAYKYNELINKTKDSFLSKVK